MYTEMFNTEVDCMLHGSGTNLHLFWWGGVGGVGEEIGLNQ